VCTPAASQGGKIPHKENLGFDGGGGRYGDGSAERCGAVVGVESAMGDVEGGWGTWDV
jgi:hypothetical protein